MTDAATLGARGNAHRALDRLWRRGPMPPGLARDHLRSLAYLWLADQLGLTRDECHISRFDIPMCRRVIELAGD